MHRVQQDGEQRVVGVGHESRVLPADALQEEGEQVDGVEAQEGEQEVVEQGAAKGGAGRKLLK